MDIKKIANKIEQLYVQIDTVSNVFMNSVEIKCPIGCDKCCHGKNITASPLEYIPFALYLFENGLLEVKYWEFEETRKELCFFLDLDTTTLKGRCGNYQFRGISCRLFGNAASLVKNGQKSFSGCSILKAQIIDQDQFHLNVNRNAPVYSDYYMNLRAIDNNYGGMLLPINEAILKAMEIVYYNTRKKRSIKSKI